jgi:hypothetical protein
MQISPEVPFIGFVVIAGNIVFAALQPRVSPVLLGVQLFIGGMVTLVVSVVDLLNPVGISGTERLLLFIAGCVNCSAGYYMVLLEGRRRDLGG